MRGPRRIAGVVVALLLLVASRAGAAQRIDLTASLAAYYDDNILQYSSDQLARFEAGTSPAQFSIRRRDDRVWNPSLVTSWETSSTSDRRHGLRLKGEGRFHQENGTCDFRSLSVGWREWFPSERRLALSYYVLPHYYLRQLQDLDDPELASNPGLASTWYRRADFELQIASAGWNQRILEKTRLELSYQYERRRYNSRFRERDSGTHQAEAGLVWNRLPSRASVDLRGGYRISDARAGSFIDPRNGQTAPHADLSYHGIVGGANGSAELARRGRLRLQGDLAWEIETRDFDARDPADRIHFGRLDVFNAGEAGLRGVLRRHWSLRGFYRIESNHARLGAPLASSTDPASYRVNQAGIVVEWSGAIWRSAADAAEEEGTP